MSRFFEDNTVQLVKDAADIVEVVGESVNLKKAGVNYKGLCPFHSEKTPSFTVNQGRRSFHCFGCGEGGDVIAFVMRFHNLTFVDALKQLAHRYNIALPEKVLSKREQELAGRKKIIYEINQRAAQVYRDFLLKDPAAAPARAYLAKREIPASVIDSFELGFAPGRWDFLLKELKKYSQKDLEEAGLIVASDRGGYYDRFRDRILFPICSHSGQYLGFGGRILGSRQPKYLNSPETPVFNKSRTLFGLWQNKEAVRNSKRCLIVEGNFDLLALVAHGIKDVVAPLGTALTRQHVRAIKGYAQEAILLFDGDQAGINAAMRAAPIFLSEKLPAKVVILPEEHDPDTFVTNFGHDVLEVEVKKALSLPEFVFGRLVEKHGLSLEGKGRIVDELKPTVEAIQDNHLQRTLFVSHFSQKLGLTPEQLLGNISAPARGKESVPLGPAAQEAGPHAELKLSKTEEQLLSFLIVYPEYLERFMESGLNEAVAHPSGQIILNRMIELSANEAPAGPEELLDATVGPERGFISKQLIMAPEFPEDEREAEAREKICWLEENRVKVKMKSLTAKINEAQRQNNESLLMELLKEKSKLGQFQEK